MGFVSRRCCWTKWNALKLVCCYVSLLSFDKLVASTVGFVHVQQSSLTRTLELRRPCRPSQLYASIEKTITDTSSRSKESLSSLTVKELRTLLKDSGLNERGLLSRLKKKQDLIDFLSDNLRRTATEAVSSSKSPELLDIPLNDGVPNKSSSSLDSRISPTKPVSMPNLVPTKVNGLTSPKHALFQKLYVQYPPLEGNNCTGIGDEDIRQAYHPIFHNQNRSMSDMDIIFVGTASCTPGVTRGVSCTALRLNWKRKAFQFAPAGTETATSSTDFSGGTWLFDCGECTQLQVQKTPSLKPSKITKIFITHSHGDHSFGLPGLLCLMGQDRDRENSPPVDIYGPEGLRMWLRVAIRYSVSRIVPNYRVHELKDIPMAPEWKFNPRAGRFTYRGIGRKELAARTGWGYQGLAGEDPSSWISRANMLNLEKSKSFGELDGGKDIFPIYDHPLSSDGAPVWEVADDDDDVKVYAAPMSHGIPCVGYVVEEQSRPGRLRNEVVAPVVERNLDALKDAGFQIPKKAFAVIKNLPEGSAFTFPDGTVVTQQEAVEPPRKGRKVVICGDTASAKALAALAKDADVVVHEATNSYLTGIDKDTNLQAVTRDAVMHGHSTPYIAGDFAKRTNAKKLIMNHFSARYKGDQSVDSMSIMTRLEGQAAKASGLSQSDIAAAWDFMLLPVPHNRC